MAIYGTIGMHLKKRYCTHWKQKLYSFSSDKNILYSISLRKKKKKVIHNALCTFDWVMNWFLMMNSCSTKVITKQLLYFDHIVNNSHEINMCQRLKKIKVYKSKYSFHNCSSCIFLDLNHLFLLMLILGHLIKKIVLFFLLKNVFLFIIFLNSSTRIISLKIERKKNVNVLR